MTKLEWQHSDQPVGYDEAVALRIGWAYEQATDFAGRVPPGLEA